MGSGGPDGGTHTWVTIQQAATYACRDERTVRRWITQGLVVERRTASGRRMVVLQQVMVVEARVRTAPRRRQLERLAAVFTDGI